MCRESYRVYDNFFGFNSFIVGWREVPFRKFSCERRVSIIKIECACKTYTTVPVMFVQSFRLTEIDIKVCVWNVVAHNCRVHDIFHKSMCRENYRVYDNFWDVTVFVKEGFRYLTYNVYLTRMQMLVYSFHLAEISYRVYDNLWKVIVVSCVWFYGSFSMESNMKMSLSESVRVNEGLLY